MSAATSQDLTVSVGVLGASGRMGREVISALQDHRSLDLGVAIQRADLVDEDRFRGQVSGRDLIIDFTTAEAQPIVSERLLGLQEPPPLVTGVTGLGPLKSTWLNEYAERAPVFWAANFSVGVALMKRLSELAAYALGDDFDAEIYEQHHRGKLDAPSGTARVLAEAICEGKRRGGEQGAYVSLTHTAPRDPKAVQVSAGRGGGVFGDHIAFFLGASEQIEIKHRALTRQVFASGALRAATWIQGRPAGLYGMDDLWSN